VCLVAVGSYAEDVLTTLVAIVPSAGALFLFWIALRAILQADRRERVAQARIEAAQDRAAAAAAESSVTGSAISSTGVVGGETGADGEMRPVAPPSPGAEGRAL
jgi:threonine/homoserine/homoserine lactone efflux protein